MHNKELENLMERYTSGHATKEERDLIETWYNAYESEVPPIKVPQKQIDQDQSEGLNRIFNEGHNNSNSPLAKIWVRLAVAASVLICVSYVIIHLNSRHINDVNIAQLKNTEHDILPGSNKAILTLANGSSIVISGNKVGTLASQNGTIITKTKDGQIRYQNSKNIAAGLSYNTAATPRGGKYQLILSDGTRVWLNSASSIKYPVVFAANERTVELTGEAYFEVAHDKKKPFRVVSNGQTVEVLGTHFNINAYSDESEVKTTLLEGSVKVSSANLTSILKPGDQSQFSKGKINVAQVDVDEVMAWETGYFNFKDDNIQTVMRQLARWYDVDVKYEGAIPKKEYSGEISMNLTASQLLDILSFNKIHYRIDGKTIVIIP